MNICCKISLGLLDAQYKFLIIPKMSDRWGLNYTYTESQKLPLSTKIQKYINYKVFGVKL